MCNRPLKMRLLFCVFALIGALHAQYLLPPTPWVQPYAFRDVNPIYEVPCNFNITSEVVLNFQNAVFETISVIFRKTEMLSNSHFSFSPLTMWQTLAALAEGSDGETKQQLYRFLGLPEDKCVRQMYYYLASTREPAGSDVVLDRKRLFIADSSVALNGQWENFVRSQQLLDVASVPFKSNPPAFVQSWQQEFNTELYNLNLNGNSVILESLDYMGLWTSAFSDSTIVTGPFYNRAGQQIGSMEYMKMQMVVNMTYLPSLDIKIVELPVGYNSRYRMLLALSVGKDSQIEGLQKSTIFEAFNTLKSTLEPIEVVIPRVTIISETDIRLILEQIGMTGLWNDPFATRKISEPAALPSSYIQRTTLTLDNQNLLSPNTFGPISTIPQVFRYYRSPRSTSDETESDSDEETISEFNDETDLDSGVEKTSSPSADTEQNSSDGETSEPSKETEPGSTLGQTSYPSTETETGSSLGQTSYPSIETEKGSSLGQTSYPNIETVKSSSIGQSNYPSGRIQLTPSVGQNSYPTTETERGSILGQTSFPSIETERGSTLGQTNYPSIESERGSTLGQTSYPNIERGSAVGQSSFPSSSIELIPTVGQAINPSTATERGQFVDFIANRPFWFGLFDSETLMCVLASSYSKVN